MSRFALFLFTNVQTCDIIVLMDELHRGDQAYWDDYVDDRDPEEEAYWDSLLGSGRGDCQ